MSNEEDDFDLPETHAPEELAYDTDYTTGQDNVQVLGLDMHNPVFFVGAFLIAGFVVCSLLFPHIAKEVFQTAKNATLHNFDWFFVITSNFAALFCLVVGLSKFGKIRLGGPDAKPEFGTLSWLAMLFSAGVGIGMVFYGAAEPLSSYTGWSGTPLGAAPLTPEAQRLAFSATIFHWGLTPWAIYAVIGLALAYFTFNRGLPLTVRSAFYPLFGERIWGWPGHIIDLTAVVATLFGLATSLGLGAKQAASGMHFLFGVDAGLQTQVILICGITGLAIFSVVRGLDGGVKLLSNINIVIAIILLLFVIAVGPTMLILESFPKHLLAYVQDVPRLSNWIGRDDKEWFYGWTIFYWAWWISWSPFVGMFIARVSKGRTIREFLAAVIILPSLVAVVWFSAFGVTAVDQVERGVGTLPDGIKDVSLVLFQMLDQMPMAQISSLVAIVLLIVFFVTSSDSGSLVIDSITAGGKLHAPVPQRIFWASMEGLVAIVLLVGGGSAALSSLQAGAIAVGLPFALVLIVCCISLWRGLMTEAEINKSDVASVP